MIMGLVARIDTPGAVKLARAIAEFLLERDVDIVLDTPLAQELTQYQDRQCDIEDMDVDMVVAMGEMEPSSAPRALSATKKFP